MSKLIVLMLVLAACKSRTELMFGVATDLKAPEALDAVQLDITRVKDGFVEGSVVWDISGSANVPFNLPGSYGVTSDGEEVQLDIRLIGLKGGDSLVSRRSVVSLVEGETLFYRIGLSAGCIDRNDCPETSSCVEGICRDVGVPSGQLPDFNSTLVTELTCAPGVQYIDTATGEPMPLSTDAMACPAGQCLEGTCLKPPPDQSGTRTVRGSKVNTFIEPTNKTTQTPIDLSGLQVAAIVLDDAGNAMTFAGSGSADGTFSIPDVPRGTYTLKVGADFTVTSADNVDLGQALLGKPNRTAVVDDVNTGIAFNVTGMAPWQDGNLLTAYAPLANDWWFFFNESMATPPTVGQTTLNTNLAFQAISDGTDLFGNEPVALIQYTNKTASDGTTIYQAPTKLLTKNATVTEGSFGSFNGAFVDIPQTETLTLDVRELEWENAIGWDGQHANLINPTAVPVNPFDFSPVANPALSMDLFGQPGGGNYGQFSSTIDYFFIQAPAGKNSTFTDLSFGKPDIGGYVYAPVLFAGSTFRVQYLLPGTTTPANQFFTISDLRVATSNSLAVTPTLSPIRNVTIDGMNAFQGGITMSETPTIQWSAPAIGSPTQYTVRVFKLEVSGNTTTKTAVAAIHTTDTTLVVPPGIFEPGSPYYILIALDNDTNIDAPARNRFPSAFAQVGSAIFTIGTRGGTDPKADGSIGVPVDAPGQGSCSAILQAGCMSGFACYANVTGNICEPAGSSTPGTSCVENKECSQGSGCAGNVCRAYCDFNQFPNMQGPCGAQVCRAFNPDGTGVCQ